MNTTFDTIRRLAVETLDVPEVRLLRARTLREAGVDSLATLDLLSTIEAHFGIHISAEELADVRSLHDFAVLTERLVSRQAGYFEAGYDIHEAHHEA
jgi:acyl carrier protein